MRRAGYTQHEVDTMTPTHVHELAEATDALRAEDAALIGRAISAGVTTLLNNAFAGSGRRG